MTRKITILGAGLVGSLLAVLFRKKKYAVTVLERRADMRLANLYAGRSINLAMSHRGWQALENAGLKTVLEAVAIPMFGRQIHNLDGIEIFQAYGKNNEAIYSVSRSALNLQLLQSAEDLGAEFIFNTKSNSIDIQNNIINCTNTTETKTVEADLLIGADGAFSSLRNAYTMLDKCDYQQFYIEHGYKELHIPPLANGNYAMQKEALHIWPRKNFMLIALPNTDGSFTLTLFFPYKGEISFEALNSDEEITTFFSTYFADAVPLMPNFLTDYKNNPIGSLITTKINKWVYKDKSLIIGDAAHAIVPFYGQGMNAGFEDCSELFKIIENNDHSNWDNILEEYQKARVVNGHAVAQLALNNFIEMRDLVADPLFLERKKIEKELGILYPNVYNSVYEMVSFSHTPYSKALHAANAQNNLYNKIMQHTTNFFVSIADAYFKTKLDIWMQEYKAEEAMQ